MKRITIKDLSNYLSISKSTISRALVNDKNINPDTKKRILEAVEKLGYKPNPAALNLKYGQSKSIGMLVPEMTTPFSSKVLQGIQNVLYPLGYRVIIMQSDENPLIERKNLLLLEEFNVDGIIMNLCHENYNQDVYQQVMERGTPLVFFDRIPDQSLDASKVMVSDRIKASLMVEHLVGTGRKKIVHIMGPSTIRNAAERASGYKRILTKYNIFDPELMIRPEGMMFEHGRNAAKKLLDAKVEFDGIFAFTDTLAIGAMNYLLEEGIRIPEDVAIASFSGTELATIVHPQLTSVEQPLVEMGEKAAELIMEKIKDAAVPSKTIMMDAELIYRASTKR
ncbi:LacI family transcriptional regulator [Elizabethkingia meningoseptica]|uniref:LacI family transcriptional regulator n=1 Tax=Elizabethkingia meningoseptica TaxID=238 RepID=A0A1T3EWS3_ELIME|nr:MULTISPECIES: LacI family DNA-binding transcriptional regulator [Elizabethkingia]AQX11627.1 LacI family transcriptional regulator [Elizabethkingia meningoseptica]MBG0513062.1 LacI family DNA-binding transcriptional regulator [Elizabethkingia meningoseptica]MDE5432633.1 LacI family transcriptional regulator [Elizabethkingia meningoseptica]MDE5436178.1 LacI family transcriptional regulator [Elizabethkingia meningoseptica]MDE5439705.1 LacI family transcriptional regulator [Elizabethkingia meni